MPKRIPAQSYTHRYKALAAIGLSMVVISGVLVFALMSSSILGTAQDGAPSLTISVETTYLTEPLRQDGTVDYLAALNQIAKHGVTPENNASVLLWQALGTGPLPAGIRRSFFEMLGVPTPDADGNYFVSPERFLKEGTDADNLANGLQEERELADLKYEFEIATFRPWSGDEFPLVGAWLNANAEPLSRVIEATQRPRRYDPLVAPPTDEPQVWNAAFPLLDNSRDIARLLETRAMFYLGCGEAQLAWEDLLACHRLSSLIDQGPSLADGLAALIIKADAFEGMRKVAHYAELNHAQITKMRDEIRQLPQLSSLVDRIDAFERCATLDYGMHLNGAYSTDKSNRLADGFIRSMVGLKRSNPNIVCRQINSWWDRVVDSYKITSHSERIAALDALQLEHQELSANRNSLGGIAKAMVTPRNSGPEIILMMSQNLVLPGIIEAVDFEDRCELHLTWPNLAFALAAYRIDHLAYPNDVAVLVPDYIDDIPLDHYSARAIGYRKTDEGYLLHSVGPDGIDQADYEAGVREADNNATPQESDDVIYRMPPAEISSK